MIPKLTLTLFWYIQPFHLSSILPSPVAIAATVAVPSILSQTKDPAFLQPYGLLGEFARVGAVGAGFAAFL